MPDFLGKNDLKSREMLLHRTVYNAYALAELDQVDGPTIETLQIKDFQKDEKLLIGRVDRTKNPVFVDSAYIKPFASSFGGSNKSALNFVVDAFQDMQSKFEANLLDGNLDPNSVVLTELKVKKAYVEPMKRYDKYLKARQEEFKSYVISERRIEEIRDFDSFVKVFMDFVYLTGKNQPFTKSMFILERGNSVLSSGLAVEIHEGDYGDDRQKIDLFYRDPNFEYLKNLAYAHGFVIDKHIPWRLVADMNSPQMTPYIRNSLSFPGASASVVLFMAFNKTYADDINSLASLMVDFYNTIVSYRSQTVVREPTGVTEYSSGRMVFSSCRRTETIRRMETSLPEVIRKYSNGFWLDIYARIRNSETGIQYSEVILANIIKNATDLVNSLDRSNSLRYIRNKFDNLEHFEGSLFHDITRLEMSEDPTATGKSVDEVVRRSVQVANFVVY